MKVLKSLKMLGPLALVVASNTIYHICSKSIPEQLNTFGALTVTYTVAAIASAILFAIGVGPAHMGEELAKVNWAPIVLGIVIIGLEAGFMLMYRGGWPVSTASLVANILLAVVLLAVGLLFFHEAITLRQIIGIGVCAVGLFLITA